MVWDAWLSSFTVVGVLLALALTRIAPDAILLAAMSLLLVTGVLSPTRRWRASPTPAS